MLQEINAEMPYISAIFKLIMWIRSSLSTLIHRNKFLKSGISNTKSFYRSYSMNNILKILLEVKVRKTLIEQKEHRKGSFRRVLIEWKNTDIDLPLNQRRRRKESEDVCQQ